MRRKVYGSYYNIYLCFSILCAILSILGDQFNVGAIDYAIFFLFFIISIVLAIKQGKLVIPKKFLSILLLYIILIIINAFISPYTVGIKYVIIGSIITLIPFVLFFISYNYNLSIREIERLIDIWIYLIISLCLLACAETFLLKTNVYYQEAILKISVIKPGFFASLCNQGVILCLYRYSITHSSKYSYIALLLTLCSLLTVQLKVVIGLLLIWAIYLNVFAYKSKGTIIVFLLFIVCIGIITFINVPPLYEKVIKYTTLYGAADSYETVARPALYYQSVNMANDFFPLGTGQGTFGSIPANMVYNQVYYDYNLSQIHGLGETGENFKMDTHWSSILGENGYLGMILYLILFYYPLSYIKRLKRHSQYKSVRFLIITVFTVITIESITLCIPGRMAFMFIYAGILGLICRQMSMNQ